jgi:hypothetical protein
MGRNLYSRHYEPDPGEKDWIEHLKSEIQEMRNYDALNNKVSLVAREKGWTDEEFYVALAFCALSTLQVVLEKNLEAFTLFSAKPPNPH